MYQVQTSDYLTKKCWFLAVTAILLGALFLRYIISDYHVKVYVYMCMYVNCSKQFTYDKRFFQSIQMDYFVNITGET